MSIATDKIIIILYFDLSIERYWLHGTEIGYIVLGPKVLSQCVT